MTAGDAFATSRQLLATVASALEGGDCSVPVLVLQLPGFAELAWNRNTRAARRLERSTSAAFFAAARGILREGDVLAHDPDSDWFAIALLAPSRAGTAMANPDARSTLERIAAGMPVATGSRVRSGWCNLTIESNCDDIGAVIAPALERGERERERYEFFAAVGHELRTPLTSIRGYIETLLDEEVDEATARRFLVTARKEALRLGRLVEGMIDFSMLDLAPSSISHRATNVADVVRGAVESLGPIARERHIRINVRAPDSASARIDPDACTHAIVNLIENALKYGRCGGRVEIAVDANEDAIRVEVDDDGPGVAECERETVFLFGSRGSRSSTAPGRGIGLAIVRTIAERAAGRAWVERSTLGGAHFVFEVPLDARRNHIS